MRNLNGENLDFNDFIKNRNCILIFLPKIGENAKFLPSEVAKIPGLTGCSNECKIYNENLEKFRNLNYEIFAISSLEITELREFAKGLNVNFEFFCDSDFSLENRLNLKTITATNGKKFYHRQSLIFKNGECVKRFEMIAKPEKDAENSLKNIG